MTPKNSGDPSMGVVIVFVTAILAAGSMAFSGELAAPTPLALFAPPGGVATPAVVSTPAPAPAGSPVFAPEAGGSPPFAASFAAPIRGGVYLGLGLDNLDAFQYEAVGTDFDWGFGAGPGGGMLISFVDPDSEAYRKGILWGDILLGIEWGVGGPQNIGAMRDFELASAQIQPGESVKLFIFQQGKIKRYDVIAAPWPSRALSNWPQVPGKGPYYFPWLKNNDALVDYRASQLSLLYRTENEPLALKDIADTYFMTDRYDKAALTYQAYLKTNAAAAGTHYPACYGMAYSARLSGKWDLARQAAEQAVSIRPRSHLALFEWAIALYNQGQISGALRLIENALAVLPPNQEALRQSLEEWRIRLASAEATAPVVTPKIDVPPPPVATPFEPPQIAQDLPEESPTPAPAPTASPALATPTPGILPPQPAGGATPPERLLQRVAVEMPEATEEESPGYLSMAIPEGYELVGDAGPGAPPAAPTGETSAPAPLNAEESPSEGIVFPAPAPPIAPGGEAAFPAEIAPPLPGEASAAQTSAAPVRPTPLPEPAIAPPLIFPAPTTPPTPAPSPGMPEIQPMGPATSAGETPAGATPSTTPAPEATLAPFRDDRDRVEAFLPSAFKTPAPEAAVQVGPESPSVAMEIKVGASAETTAAPTPATALATPGAATPHPTPLPGPALKPEQPAPAPAPGDGSERPTTPILVRPAKPAEQAPAGEPSGAKAAAEDKNKEPLEITDLQTLLPAYPGASVVIVLQYAVRDLPDDRNLKLTETVRLTRGDKTYQMWTQESMRQTGTPRISIFFRIPPELKPGDYQLEAAVRGGEREARKTAALRVLDRQ